MDTGTSSYAGLFGYVSGTLRDIGVVGGSVKGGSYVGGLAGYISGTISNAYATGAVTAASGSYNAGGLVGFQDGGTISEAYATGALSGGGSDVGGLVGESYGTIDDAYATGAISGGGANFGGLVGASLGTISNAYATGAVNGGSALDVGGLVGYQYSGTISSAYATGAVSGSGSDVGGLVGGSGSTISNAYWDTGTSGQSSSGGGTAQTTATSQADSLSTLGFDSSVWGTGTGLYPYLKSFFPNGAQAVSGTAYKDAGANVAASNASGAVTVGLDSGGAFAGQATTGANGYYYIALPAGMIANGSDMLVSVPTNASTGAVKAATLAASTYAGADTIQSGARSLWQLPVRGDERHHIVGR